MVILCYCGDGYRCFSDIGGYNYHPLSLPIMVVEHSLLLMEVKFREQWVHYEVSDLFLRISSLLYLLSLTSNLSQLKVILLVVSLLRLRLRVQALFDIFLLRLLSMLDVFFFMMITISFLVLTRIQSLF